MYVVIFLFLELNGSNHNLQCCQHTADEFNMQIKCDKDQVKETTKRNTKKWILAGQRQRGGGHRKFVELVYNL